MNEITYAIAPTQGTILVGIYFYDADGKMLRAFIDNDFDGKVTCDGWFRMVKRPDTENFDNLLEFAETELEEIDPSCIETIGLVEMPD